MRAGLRTGAVANSAGSASGGGGTIAGPWNSRRFKKPKRSLVCRGLRIGTPALYLLGLTCGCCAFPSPGMLSSSCLHYVNGWLVLLNSPGLPFLQLPASSVPRRCAGTTEAEKYKYGKSWSLVKGTSRQRKDERDNGAGQGLAIAVKCISERFWYLGSWTLSHLYFQNADHLMCSFKEFFFVLGF